MSSTQTITAQLAQPTLTGLDTTAWTHEAHAHHYTYALGFHLVPIPQGHKGPRTLGWNKPENALSDPQQAAQRFGHSHENMGLLHSASGTVVLDIDDEEAARQALGAVNLDLADLLGQNPYRIRGRKGEKPVYRLPANAKPKPRKLAWPSPAGKHDFTVLELRCGDQQDVLPPSIHPEMSEPYAWVNGAPATRDSLPELPQELLTLLQNWEDFSAQMRAACPWQQPTPMLAETPIPQARPEVSVIEAFNARFSPGEILERNGYRQAGPDRWVAPGSTSGTAGVHLLAESDPPRVYSHHAADPLSNEHGHDAFSVLTILEYGGNTKEAARAGAMVLGLDASWRDQSAQPSAGSTTEHSTDQRRSKSTRALQLVLDQGEPWRDEEGQAYLTVLCQKGHEHHRLNSRGARDYISDLFFDQVQSVLGGQALNEVIEVLAARARRVGKVHPTGQRVKRWQGRSYLDLGREDWLVVEIAEGSWNLISAQDCPVRFTRSPQMLPLPLPERQGDLGNLSELLNTNRSGLLLCTAFLLGALSARGPYALLAFKGEQGVGKSTAASTLQRLIDPSTATRRRAPRKEQDLFIAARSSHVLSFDNLSSISADLSDSLCALSTGGSFATRTLHTNEDETVLQAMRPAILNGIADLLTRADLAERTLLVELHRIDPSQRLTEYELEERFTRAHPKLLGALLTALATGFQRLDETHLPQAPRLADFARLIVAAEPSLPWEPGEFLRTYTAMQDEAAQVVLEGDDLAQAVQTFLNERGWWTGPVAQLLALLNEQEGIMAGFKRPAHDWPKSPRALGERLRRLAPALSKTGCVTESIGRRKDGVHYRMRKTDSPTFTTYTHAE